MIKAFHWFWRDPSPNAQRARRLAKLLVLLALLIALFWIIPLRAVLQALLIAHPGYTAIGLLLVFVAMVFTAVEMVILTRHQGIQHTLGEILAINLAIKFYLQFTPTTLVGSGIRWYRLAQPGGKTAEALAALTFFRVLEVFLALSIGVGLWLLSGQELVRVNIVWIAGLVGGVFLAWVLITRYSLVIFRFIVLKTGAFQKHRFIQLVIGYLEKFLKAIATYATIPLPKLLLAVLAGVASATTFIVSSFFLARAVGMNMHLLDIGWIEAVVSLATQLPFAVAGGLGIREVTLVAILSTFGITPEMALAYSFLLLLRGFLLSLAGGLIEALDVFGMKSFKA